MANFHSASSVSRHNFNFAGNLSHFAISKLPTNNEFGILKRFQGARLIALPTKDQPPLTVRVTAMDVSLGTCFIWLAEAEGKFGGAGLGGI